MGALKVVLIILYSGLSLAARCAIRHGSLSSAESFMTNYSIVVMDGHIHPEYRDSIHGLIAFVQLLRCVVLQASALGERPTLIGKQALDFLLHFEKEYYRYKPEPVRLCKSTLHLLLHLMEHVEVCGPLALYNQWWVERYVEFVKHKLHASIRAAESLTENARFLESSKMFFKEHFVSGEDDKSEGDGTVGKGLSPEKVENLSNFRVGGCV